ncbi:MAG TPA: sn-glycerol-1-phosphate dehydrogenase [Clostridia bacterium]|nr:sn-glycerol-1-phosphate dehydrogenase [Clostridia bacterium]
MPTSPTPPRSGPRLTIQQALGKARETRRLELGGGVIGRTAAMFKELFGERDAVMVADPNTFRAAGKSVAEALQSRHIGGPEPFIFDDPSLYAEHRFVEVLEQKLRMHTAVPVAVGSGTINDLTKLAAHRTGRPYMCVATAASMDGYSAFGASITFQGSKQTFFCPAPAGVVADLDIIAKAPGEMNSWGYADFLAKITAGADWLVADALGVEPIDGQAWDIVQKGLRDLLAQPEGVPAGDAGAIGRLMEGLILGGFAMQWAQSSRPASGAEHQFSHLWDMQHHTHNGKAPSHGFKVGIGTLAITALYEFLLRQPLEKLDVNRSVAGWADSRTWVERARRLFGTDDLATVACREVEAKHDTPEQLQAQLERLRTVWPQLREQLSSQLFPFTVTREKLLAAGAPVDPEAIGISRERLRESYWLAFYIRRRFTVLDIAVRTGLLDPALDHIFGDTGPWPIQP